MQNTKVFDEFESLKIHVELKAEQTLGLQVNLSNSSTNVQLSHSCFC